MRIVQHDVDAWLRELGACYTGRLTARGQRSLKAKWKEAGHNRRIWLLKVTGLCSIEKIIIECDGDHRKLCRRVHRMYPKVLKAYRAWQADRRRRFA